MESAKLAGNGACENLEPRLEATAGPVRGPIPAMYEHPADEPGAASEHLRRFEDLRHRLRSEGRRAAVLCVGASGRAALERAAPGRAAELAPRVRELVAGLPRAGELLAIQDAENVLVLLEASPEAAALAAELLVEEGRELSLRPDEPPVWAGVHVGLALDPAASELFLETLVAVAQEGAAVAHSRGGECVVHTRLYDLVQKRLERKRGLVSSPAARRAELASATEELARVAREHEHAASAAALAGDGAPKRRAELEERLRALLVGEGHAPLADPASAAVIETNGNPARASGDPVLEPGTTLSRSEVSLLDDERLLALARRIANETVELQRRELDERHRAEIDLLERRIRRLVSSLEETELEMQRLAAVASRDGGVASTYRTVQGLTASEANYAAKRELMTQLLEANLELRRKIAESAA